MKKAVSIIFLTVFLIFSFASCAPKADYSIGIPKGFAAAYSTDDTDELAKALGVDTKEIKSYFKEDKLALMAVNSDNSVQIKLSRFVNSYSKAIQSFSSDDENIIKDYASAAGIENYKIVSSNDTKFIFVKTKVSDSDGGYVSSRYITVKNGEFYVLSCFNRGDEQDKKISEVFKSLDIKTDTASLPVWQTVLIAGSIALFTAVIAAVAVGFIKARKSKSEAEENQQ